MFWLLLVVIISLTTACQPGSDVVRHEATPEIPTQPARATPASTRGIPSPTAVPTRRPTWTLPPELLAVPTDTTFIPAEPMYPRGEIIAETEHFKFYAEDGYFPVDLDWLGERAETLLDYVAGRLGGSVEEKISLFFEPSDGGSCPPRGMAIGEGSFIILYADEQTSRVQLEGVLAHEIAHIVDVHTFEGGPAGTPLFREGLATWAAGPYYAEWQDVESFDAHVRAAIEAERYVPLSHDDPLTPSLGEDCLARRDLVYMEWASFVEFLVTRYGMDKLRALLGVPFPPDSNMVDKSSAYREVYGKSLEELEAEWLASLAGTAMKEPFGGAGGGASLPGCGVSPQTFPLLSSVRMSAGALMAPSANSLSTQLRPST